MSFERKINMKTIRKFAKDDLLELVDERPDAQIGKFTLISEQIIDHDRWTIRFELCFKYEDTVYITYYSIGATEYQDEGPFENDGDEIDCYEAMKIEVPKWVIKGNII